MWAVLVVIASMLCFSNTQQIPGTPLLSLRLLSTPALYSHSSRPPRLSSVCPPTSSPSSLRCVSFSSSASPPSFFAPLSFLYLFPSSSPLLYSVLIFSSSLCSVFYPPSCPSLSLPLLFSLLSSPLSSLFPLPSSPLCFFSPRYVGWDLTYQDEFTASTLNSQWTTVYPRRKGEREREKRREEERRERGAEERRRWYKGIKGEERREQKRVDRR